MRFILISISFFFCAYANAQIDIKSYTAEVGEILLSKSEKQFKQSLYKHYRKANGADFNCSFGLAQDVFRIISKRNLLNKKRKTEFIRFDKGVYWYRINTYYTKYGLTLGSALFGFRINEQDKSYTLVAIEDVFDFNKKKIGNRPLAFEVITRSFKMLGKIRKGDSFKIVYLASDK